MKFASSLLLFLSTLSLAAGQGLIDDPNAFGGNNDNDEVDIVFMYKNEQGRGQGKAMGLQVEREIPGMRIVAMKATRGRMNALKNNPNIESVDYNYVMEAIEDPQLRGNRRLDTSPYGIDDVQALDFGDVTRPTSTVRVCVIDTGYDNDHVDLPDLDENTDGFNPFSGQEWFVDGNNHGTHVAGTIGAIGDNGIGVESVLSNSVLTGSKTITYKFFIGKGLSDSGSGTTATVLNAVNACKNVAADGIPTVMNLSLGGGGFSSTDNNAYRQAFDAGVLLVAAAGNGGNSAFGYPASYSSLMSVAAVNSNGDRASFSQFNSQVEIAAPGVSVQSTIPGNRYAFFSGTSMASPHVAGVAALVWSYFPQCTNLQIRNVLLLTAMEESGGTGCDTQYGHGIVQARAAYDLLERDGCIAGGPASGGSVVGGCAQGPDPVTSPTTPSPAAAPTTASPVAAPTTAAPVATCNLAGVGESCVVDGDCCSNKCRGPRNRKTCKNA